MSALRSIYLLSFTLLIFLFLFSGPAPAQSKAYRIGPRDVLTLTVSPTAETPEVGSRVVRIVGTTLLAAPSAKAKEEVE